MRMARRWYRSVLLLIVPILLFGVSVRAQVQDQNQTAAQPQAAKQQLLQTADEVLNEVAKLRGLEPKEPIRKELAGKEEIARYLDEQVRLYYPANLLRREGLMLQKLDLIPAGMDYQEFLLKLLTEQVGGFYDLEKKDFYIADWLPGDQQRPVMAHELTHALQDQYFDLESLFKRDLEAGNDDKTLAHQALAEGDATGVMFDLLLAPKGRNILELPDMVFVMQQLAALNEQYPVFSRAPEFLKQMLMFPYGYGLAFIQKVRAPDKPWSAVDRLYSDPPESTEQIIHPEKYLGDQQDRPVEVTARNLSAELGGGWKTTYRNVMGEFGLYLFLKSHISNDQAKRAAAGWGGDQAVLLEAEEGRKSAAFLSTVWDSQEDSDQFFLALQHWIEQRWPKARKVEESTDYHAVIAGGGFHSIRRDGTKVEFLTGLPEADAARLKGPAQP